MSRTAVLIGDSISNGYHEYVAELLSADDIAIVWYSGGSSAQVLAGLGEWIDPDNSPHLVHFNCGLHDSRYFKIASAYQQPLANYTALLTGAVTWLRTHTSAKLVWATTTPVITERIEAYFEQHPNKVAYLRYSDDVAAYNKAAREIMEDAGIHVNDLFEVVRKASPETILTDDGVHMTDEGYKLVAHAVATSIRTHLL